MIKERKGDLLRSDAAIIAHQVNCQGVMGAGVARQIRHRILTAEQYRAYQQLCRKNKEELLGSCSLMLRMDTGATQYVAHLFAENIPTGRGLDTDYAALRQSLTAMMFLAAQRELSQVAIPGYLAYMDNGGISIHPCIQVQLQRCKYSQCQLGYRLRYREKEGLSARQKEFLERPAVLLFEDTQGPAPENLWYPSPKPSVWISRHPAHSPLNLKLVEEWCQSQNVTYEYL